jgi:hypothetical protein
VLQHPDHLLPDAHFMPISSQAYFLLLHESGLLDNFSTDLTEPAAFKLIDKAFLALFKDKTVYFLPGRNGQAAAFARNYGAQIGLCTDDRYIRGVLSYLSHSRLGEEVTHLDSAENIALIAEVKVSEILFALAAHRPDIQALLAGHDFGSYSKRVHHLDEMRTEPEIVICTNLFNDKRFEKSGSVHTNNVSWSALLFRILATGVVGNYFCICASFLSMSQ